MSRVDFYVLSAESADAGLRYACRLIEKAVDLDHRIYVQTDDASTAQRIDELLWTFNDRSFLPHQVWDGNETAHPLVKVLIGTLPAPPSHRQVLVNFAAGLPQDCERYARIVEIVDADPERRRLSRQRYKQYRERGCELETHNV